MTTCSRHDAEQYVMLQAMDDDQLVEYAKIHVSTDSSDLIEVLAERIGQLKQEIENWRGNG